MNTDESYVLYTEHETCPQRLIAIQISVQDGDVAPIAHLFLYLCLGAFNVTDQSNNDVCRID